MKPSKYNVAAISQCLVITLIPFFANSQTPYTPPAAYPSTNRVNYVRTWEASAPILTLSDLTSRAVADVKQSTVYVDGLGRTIQTVSRQMSPAGNILPSKDLVTANYYDPTTGLEIYKYLPFISNAAQSSDVVNDGNLKTDPFQEQVAFYNTQLSGQALETNVAPGNLNWAYNKTNYEASPLNRVSSEFASGVNWVGSETTSTPHGNKQYHLVNTTVDNVQIWNIAASTGSIPVNAGSSYAAGQLYKTISVDQNGNQAIQYKDKYGQLILNKVQLTAAADNFSGSAHSGWLCTYYVYDDYGNLRFVIPPKVVGLIDGSWGNLTGTLADQLCFRYEYDALNRMIVKKEPGTPSGTSGEIWMVYDQRDRLVMRQDPVMRSQQQWEYFQYDQLDRPTASGKISDSHNLSYHSAIASTSTTYPILTNYTPEVLTQTHYDNYNWVSGTSLSASLDQTNTGNLSYFLAASTASPYPQAIAQSTMTMGLVTGAASEVLGSNGAQYLNSETFYDEKGRAIQTQGINITGGKDILTTQYDWSGKILRNLIQEQKSGTNPQTHNILTKRSYDVAGRLITITKTINSTINAASLSSPEKTIATYIYDQLGRMSFKKLGNNLETLQYDYNIQGWLLGINRNYLTGVTPTSYFGLELAYDKSNSVLTSTSYSPQYNSNIAGTVWKTKGDPTARKYDYNYDKFNRITTANFNQNTSGSTWDKTTLNFSSSVTNYDLNGNILGLSHNGFKVSAPTGTIDQLSYQYLNSNQSNNIQYISDGSNDPASTLGDFHYAGTKTGTSIDYTYDANGNLASDLNKGISNITYTYLNKPSLITVTGKGTITFVYDATGKKLKKTVVDNSVAGKTVTTTTTYIGGFVYQNQVSSPASLSDYTDVLLYVGHEEGRTRYEPPVGSIPASFQYDYFIKDHLGNIRMVLTDESKNIPYTKLDFEGDPSTSSGLVYIANQDATWDNAVGTAIGVQANRISILPNFGTQANNGSYIGTAQKSTGSIGAAKLLKVMSGDQINVTVEYMYTSASANNSSANGLNTLASSLIGILNNSSVVAQALKSSSAVIASNTVANSSVINILSGENASTSGNLPPECYMHILFFDERFVYDPTSSYVQKVLSGVVNTKTLLYLPNPVSAKKNGYAYIYFSNESSSIVYFDNFTLTYTPGALLEETHYYPFGLTISGISSKALNGAAENKTSKFQGQEYSNDLGTDYYEFKYRVHDPQIGRFISIDPLADNYSYNAPYAFSENKLGMGVELEGAELLPLGTAWFNMNYLGNSSYSVGMNNANIPDYYKNANGQPKFTPAALYVGPYGEYPQGFTFVYPAYSSPAVPDWPFEAKNLKTDMGYAGGYATGTTFNSSVNYDGATSNYMAPVKGAPELGLNDILKGANELKNWADLFADMPIWEAVAAKAQNVDGFLQAISIGDKQIAFNSQNSFVSSPIFRADFINFIDDGTLPAITRDGQTPAQGIDYDIQLAYDGLYYMSDMIIDGKRVLQQGTVDEYMDLLQTYKAINHNDGGQFAKITDFIDPSYFPQTQNNSDVDYDGMFDVPW